MKHLCGSSLAAAALALVAGTALAQARAGTPAPTANAPAATGATTQKAAPETRQRSEAGEKNGAKQTTTQHSAVAPEAGKHVEKKASDDVASQPAKKL
jgi:hypothetical protein